MEKLREYYTLIKEDPNFSRRVFLVSLITALFILALVINNPEAGGRYIVDDSGNVIGIQRGSLKSSEEYNLNILIRKGNESDERSVVINKHAVDSRKNRQQQSSEDRAAVLEAELRGIITDIEQSDRKIIHLPDRLSDGSRLYWSAKEKSVGDYYYIPILYMLLVLLIAKSSIDKNKDEDRQIREGVLKGLPRFTNQLLLMMNAGMILSDAFERICFSYETIGPDKMGFFEKELCEISVKNSEHRVSTANLINSFAADTNVKELMRISTILMENEKRGSDIIDNLSRESRYLWDERKITAREKGKMIDTKMSYPLGLLLILLIVITMAPALLSM